MKSQMKSVFSRAGFSTVYDVEFCDKMAILEMMRKQTERMIDCLKGYAKDCQGSSMNRYEKLGEMIGNYGSKCPDSDVSGVLIAVKGNFENVGRIHRAFSQTIMDEYVKTLDLWLKTEIKALRDSVAKLNKAKSAMDSAVNRARGKEAEQELQDKKTAAEAEHMAQFEATSAALNTLSAEQEKQYKLWISFMEKEKKFFQDLNDEHNNIAKAIPF
ncbi:hypothetical protein L596_020109 [Steinernema carpocapsae]|uniref:BAR domain-containing protein n=1 Tax=Steinernema carpocapsae TaxID=34508 RepID=A0A4U5MSJ1_STECR|nr:hypothetical protein L596_020109 [Steinernema carpocapsae]